MTKHCTRSLMSEPKVEPTISDVRCRFQIMRLFLRGHRIPNLVALFVAPNVVEFRGGVKNDQVNTSDTDKNSVAAAVAGRVVLAVDVGGDNGAELHEHIV